MWLTASSLTFLELDHMILHKRMLTIMVRCQAPTTKHMGPLIARISPQREGSTYHNQYSYVGSSQPRKVRCLYITHVAFDRLQTGFLQPCGSDCCPKQIVWSRGFAQPILCSHASRALARPCGKVRSRGLDRGSIHAHLIFCPRQHWLATTC